MLHNPCWSPPQLPLHPEQTPKHGNAIRVLPLYPQVSDPSCYHSTQPILVCCWTSGAPGIFQHLYLDHSLCLGLTPGISYHAPIPHRPPIFQVSIQMLLFRGGGPLQLPCVKQRAHHFTPFFIFLPSIYCPMLDPSYLFIVLLPEMLS